MKQITKYIRISLTLLSLTLIQQNIHAMHAMQPEIYTDTLKSLVKLAKLDKEAFDKNRFENMKKIAALTPCHSHNLDFSYFLMLKIYYWVQSHDFKEHSCLFTPKEKELIRLVDKLRKYKKKHNYDKYKKTYLTIVSLDSLLTNKSERDLIVFLLKTVNFIYNTNI